MCAGRSKRYLCCVDVAETSPLPNALQMKQAVSSSYNPPDDTSGAVALSSLEVWLDSGLKLEEGKHGLGFPFMYLLLTGTVGLKVVTSVSVDEENGSFVPWLHFALYAASRETASVYHHSRELFLYKLVSVRSNHKIRSSGCVQS